MRLWVGENLVVDAWPSNIPFQQGALRLSAGVFYTFQLDFASRTGAAAVRLLWESPSLAQEVLPGSSFFLNYPIAAGSYHPVVVPAATSPNNCIAQGDGLFAAVANIPNEFFAVTRDEFNNTRGAGGDVIAAFAVRTGPNQPVVRLLVCWWPEWLLQPPPLN